MAAEELMHIKQEKLMRRLRIFRMVVYVAAVIALGSFALCIIDWQGFEWILIGATYVLLAINFGMQIRMVKKELQRGDLLS
jgi:fatty acid desaturase